VGNLKGSSPIPMPFLVPLPTTGNHSMSFPLSFAFGCPKEKKQKKKHPLIGFFDPANKRIDTPSVI